MNGESTGKAGKMTLARGISCQFGYPQQNVGAPFSFVVTYSDLP
jgi:tRNA A37 threonylcarbamoyladenosine biosynthesis protein TsaE